MAAALVISIVGRAALLARLGPFAVVALPLVGMVAALLPRRAGAHGPGLH